MLQHVNERRNAENLSQLQVTQQSTDISEPILQF